MIQRCKPVVMTLGRSLGLLALLSACGGDEAGGGSDSPSANFPPSITSPTSFTVKDGQITGVRLVAADPENDPVTFRISGGEDAERFTLSAAGDLTLKTSLFREPMDTDYDNIYQLTVSASDSTSSVSQNVTVAVERPVDRVVATPLASGFIDPITILVGQNTIVAQRNGDFYFARDGVKNAIAVPLPDIQSNGLLRASSNPALSRFQDSLRTYYLDTSGRLVATSYSYASFTGLNAAGTASILNKVTDARVLSYFADRTDAGSLSVTGASATQPGTEGLAQDSNSVIGNLTIFSVDGTKIPAQVSGIREAIAVSYVAYPTQMPRLAIADRGAEYDEINSVSMLSGPVNLGWPFKDGVKVVKNGGPSDLVDPLIAFPRNFETGEALVGSAVIGSSVVLAFRNGNLFTLPTTALYSSKPLTNAALVDRTAELRTALPNIGGISLIQAYRDRLYVINSAGTLFEVRWQAGL